MRPYLILKLEGVMQAWGGHTFEDRRPSELFPTRSGLLGLLAACLGIDRRDDERQQALAESVIFTVRVDCPPLKMTDYHTVKNSRLDYKSLKSAETIQTWREYLLDAKYTVAVAATEAATVSLDDIALALHKPVFTPFLGRRSCPLGRPLLVESITAKCAKDALHSIVISRVDSDHRLPSEAPQTLTFYTEELESGAAPLWLRDKPIPGRRRQFATRQVSIISETQGGNHVSE